MSRQPAKERDELNDDEVPTVEIPGFDFEEEKDRDTLFEGHPLIEVLTPASKVRIILAFLRVRGGELRPTDIYTKARISHDTWHKHKETLVDDYEVIEQVGQIGNSPLYAINEDSELAQLAEDMISAAGRKKRERIAEQRDGGVVENES